MKQKIGMLGLLFLGLLLSACGTEGRYQVTLITEGQHRLSGTTFGDLVILGGEATLEPGASLEGTAHVISGALNLDGKITGDLSFLGGRVNLGPEAYIGGNLNYGGGELSNLDQSMVAGRINTGTGIQIPAVESQPSQSPLGQIIRAVINAAFVALLALLSSRYLPDATERVREAAVRHVLVSLAMGLLAGIVALSLIVLMAYTILLIPVALLGIALLGLAIVYGWIAYGVALGNFTARYFSERISSRLANFGGTFIFMLLLSLLTKIPFLGGIIGILIASAALGAVFLTRFGLRRFIPETVETNLVG